MAPKADVYHLKKVGIEAFALLGGAWVPQPPPRKEVIDSFQAVQKYGGRVVVEYRTTMPVRNPYY
ncbi:hypothetical protein GIB67_021047 [Kingdonia uniflora]|uniref:Uncharacterized protein n=1 Tax=Kingdonia uniflora TaxID=39325 RepID=A0A7J7N7L5_9MAGN|nr:hypothetical protein GIB67_021047 [Kingdonia uniflora]